MKGKLERVQDWWMKAQSDLQIATHEMQFDKPAADAVCFHFQQAVEKMLKAWLVWQEIDFPQTHNIEVLLVACEKIDPSFAKLRSAEMLTPYSVDIRYADDFYFPTLNEIRDASDISRMVESFVIEKFSLIGISPLRE